MARNRLTTDVLKEGVLSSDKAILGRAITLVESKAEIDRTQALELIQQVLPFTGKSFRLGITGAPGVGKSTFIDGFANFLLNKGKRIAILAIDPSSKISGGSILGDKTRMEKLVGQPGVFIRPSPAGIELGGVGQSTLESILLCEAAGYDFIIVETVGVGQSETVVKEMTDMLMFLTIAGAGDDLQGIKRGIMEMIDLVIINKSDQIETNVLVKLKSSLSNALHLFPFRENKPDVEVLHCSALNSEGFEAIFGFILKFHERILSNGSFDENRSNQRISWMNRTFVRMIENYIYKNDGLNAHLKNYEGLVRDNKLNPLEAARQIFGLLKLQ
ncbi:MAG TPA: methylmalonyl Co-A mutase-associated GTPase MeaB [Leadbetterella sp.]|nr:methylmalonyl Co-A mutase-associated GTPase MeaB [Leadbetterella sp.]